MDVVLVDTSVLVDFFKGHPSKSALFLKANIGNMLIATCPVIVQEILQGIVSDKVFLNTQAFFHDVIQFNQNTYELAVEAAILYRELRKRGITIRKPNDCLIAVYAIKNEVPILHNDRDFDHIAAHTKLKIMKL